MSAKLAVAGGPPVRTRPFAPRQTMGPDEKRAVMDVLDNGNLSGFYGSASPQFWGGPKVRELEETWACRFGYRHAISMNSWTSGLMASVGALKLEPGDEIICPPYTMSASITSALFYGLIPVFADIDAETFCLDPPSVEAAITPRTKAIMVVHLFGRAADMSTLMDIANRHGLKIVEDAAQAPGARYRNRSVGALQDIGGFSLNYHKHIHAGEGGIVVTDDDGLAMHCKLIRNHGENVVGPMQYADITNTMGGNYRLTEIQAALTIVQLDRLDDIVSRRNELAAHLRRRLAGVTGVRIPAPPPEGDAHAYYVYPILFDGRVLDVSRQAFISAVAAELPPPASSDDWAMAGGYVKPLYHLPLFQKRSAIGSRGFPFSLGAIPDDAYLPGRCPVAERMYETDLILSFLVRDPLETADMDDFADAITKVVSNADQLRMVHAG